MKEKEILKEYLNKDHYIKVIDGTKTIKATIIITTNLVNEAKRIFNPTNEVTAALGRTLTITSIMGLMLKGKKELVTNIVKGGGPVGTILATANSSGDVKGYASNPLATAPKYANGKLNVAGVVGTTGTIQVIKDLGLKEPYNGKYKIVSGEIAEDFAHYFTISEQTPSAVMLGVLTTKQEVICAGGAVFQAMPGAKEETLDILEENLKNLISITSLLSENNDVIDIANLVFDKIGFSVLDVGTVKYSCDCNKQKVIKALISLGKTELTTILNEDKKMEVNCHFCDKKYNFNEAEIKEIIQELEDE